jgi:hypothetical protein
MRPTLVRVVLISVLSAVLALVPLTAAAQQRGGGGPPGQSGPGQPGAPGQPGGPGGPYAQHGAVVVGGGWGGYGYPPYGGYWGGYWGPYGGWGGWGPYGPYGYGYYDNSGELRLEVTPKQAQVYIDGYFAGIVDDFDGTFQRLRTTPGGHELVLYLKGYHSLKQNLHLGARQAQTIKAQLVALAAGEVDEPPPQPLPQPDAVPGRPGAPPSPAEPWWPTAQAPPADRPIEQGHGFGSLVFRVQPTGAEVLIDGERWQGPVEASERLIVQVSEGSHRVEIRKDGFAPFTTTVQVHRGETMPLNVSLPPRDR